MPGTWQDAVWRYDPTLNAPPRYRRACKYRTFRPQPLAALDVAIDPVTAGAVSAAESAVAALNAVAHPGLVPLARLLLRTESIASSKVEGLHLGAADLARAEARSGTGARVGPTAREIIGNINAMELAIAHAAAARTFALSDIFGIHERLMSASQTPRLAGKLRGEQNWIGGNDYNPCGADFVPPSPEDVRPLLRDLCRAVNDDTLPPVVQAALVHAQFETIHPFADGNGRAGRALIHVVFRRRGLAPSYVPPVSVLLASRRDGYIAGLTSFRGDDVNAWIARFADACAASAHLARGYLESVSRLSERWRALLRRHDPPREGAAAWAIIEVLPAHPVISGPAAVVGTGRARAAVYDGLDQLERAGVLKPLTQSRRNRAWEAVGLLALLEGFEAGRLPGARR